MYMVYAMIILLMVAVSTTYSTRDEGARMLSESDGYARQMGAWHRAALDKCRNGCPSGAVNPASHLPPQLQGQPAFSRGIFASRYDAGERIMVTYMTSAFSPTSSASFGTIATALSVRGMDGQTEAAGYWNGAAGRIIPIRPVPTGGTAYVPPIVLPVPFQGVSIPNGSPVMATRV